MANHRGLVPFYADPPPPDVADDDLKPFDFDDAGGIGGSDELDELIALGSDGQSIPDEELYDAINDETFGAETAAATTSIEDDLADFAIRTANLALFEEEPTCSQQPPDPSQIPIPKIGSDHSLQFNRSQQKKQLPRHDHADVVAQAGPPEAISSGSPSIWASGSFNGIGSMSDAYMSHQLKMIKEQQAHQRQRQPLPQQHSIEAGAEFPALLPNFSEAIGPPPGLELVKPVPKSAAAATAAMAMASNYAQQKQQMGQQQPQGIGGGASTNTAAGRTVGPMSAEDLERTLLEEAAVAAHKQQTANQQLPAEQPPPPPQSAQLMSSTELERRMYEDAAAAQQQNQQLQQQQQQLMALRMRAYEMATAQQQHQQAQHAAMLAAMAAATSAGNQQAGQPSPAAPPQSSMAPVPPMPMPPPSSMAATAGLPPTSTPQPMPMPPFPPGTTPPTGALPWHKLFPPQSLPPGMPTMPPGQAPPTPGGTPFQPPLPQQQPGQQQPPQQIGGGAMPPPLPPLPPPQFFHHWQQQIAQAFAAAAAAGAGLPPPPPGMPPPFFMPPLTTAAGMMPPPMPGPAAMQQMHQQYQQQLHQLQLQQQRGTPAIGGQPSATPVPPPQPPGQLSGMPAHLHPAHQHAMMMMMQSSPVPMQQQHQQHMANYGIAPMPPQLHMVPASLNPHVEKRRQKAHHHQHSALPSGKTIADYALDPYAGLMSTKEREWLIKIHLIRCLGTGDPLDDDFYYAVWKQRNVLAKAPEGSPQQQQQLQQQKPRYYSFEATFPSSGYTAPQFMGALGKPVHSSSLQPRQIIEVVGENVDEESTSSGGASKSTSAQKQQKRLRTALIRIENAALALIECRDIRRKLNFFEETRITEYLDKREITDRIARFAQNLALVDATIFGPEQLPTVMLIQKGRQLVFNWLHFLEAEEAGTTGGPKVLLQALMLNLMGTIGKWARKVPDDSLKTYSEGFCSLFSQITSQNELLELLKAAQLEVSLIRDSKLVQLTLLSLLAALLQTSGAAAPFNSGFTNSNAIGANDNHEQLSELLQSTSIGQLLFVLPGSALKLRRSDGDQLLSAQQWALIRTWLAKETAKRPLGPVADGGAAGGGEICAAVRICRQSAEGTPI